MPKLFFVKHRSTYSFWKLHLFLSVCIVFYLVSYKMTFRMVPKVNPYRVPYCVLKVILQISSWKDWTMKYYISGYILAAECELELHAGSIVSVWLNEKWNLLQGDPTMQWIWWGCLCNEDTDVLQDDQWLSSVTSGRYFYSNSSLTALKNWVCMKCSWHSRLVMSIEHTNILEFYFWLYRV